jgi:hypothetical protein
MAEFLVAVVDIDPATGEALARREQQVGFRKFLRILDLLAVMQAADHVGMGRVEQIDESEDFDQVAVTFTFKVHGVDPLG